MSISATRTKWGRTKFGDGRLPAMVIAIPGGLVLGAVLGAAAVWAGVAGPRPVLGGIVFALCLTSPGILAVYVLVADRDTMTGAIERPGESVESRWYDRAAAGALTDVVTLAGLSALFLVFVPSPPNPEPGLVPVAVIGIAFASFAIRYLLLRRKG